MSGKFTFSIATPDGPVAGGPCEFIVVPTAAGEVGVMADHAALVACVVPGELRVTVDGVVRGFRVGGGLVDVRDNTVKLLVSTAEKPAAS
jgi:F-type H+-transporting ATPase subunit epsilon